MGFYSYNCQGCGQSLRSHYAVTRVSSWMQSVVVYTQANQFYQGAYDGYGRVETASTEINLLDAPNTVYHQRCWRLLGRPKGFVSPAQNAPDQGYFTRYHPPKPQTRAELKAMQKIPQA